MQEASNKELMLLKRKLKEMARLKHLPPGLLDLVSQVAAAQIAAKPEFRLEIPQTEAVPAEVLAQGAPLLSRDLFPVDLEQTLKLARVLAGIASQAKGPLARACALALEKIENEADFFALAVTNYQKGDDAFFLEFGQASPAAPRALSFLVRSSLAPGLERVGEAMALLLDPDKPYLFGHCPICASPPLIASLKGKEGRKFLSCCYCGHTYRAQRLQCPYCLEEAPEKLPYYESEEEPGYRAQVCLSCKMYIKTVDFREFDRASLAGLDDLESLTLDLVMAKNGYSRPTLSAWGF